MLHDSEAGAETLAKACGERRLKSVLHASLKLAKTQTKVCTTNAAFPQREFIPDECRRVEGDQGNLQLARELGEKLKGIGVLLGTAESCTGGGIASLLTEIPGSSGWFAGALVTYSNDWKKQLLGVQEATLAAHGAVSQQTVTEMLDGLLGRYAVQAGLAVSGIAGPGGATPGKPVGTVFVGAAYREKRRVECCHFEGSRSEVRQQSVAKALHMLLELLDEA